MTGVTRETLSYGVPVFQNVIENAQGGFVLDEATLSAAGASVKAGTVVSIDETTRKVKVAKMGVLQGNATNVATTYNVLKGHNLVVGNTVNLTGGTGRAITAIDTTNPAYDVLTVGTTIGVAGTAGDGIYIVDAGFNSPNGLLYNDVVAGVNTEVAVALRATVYENRIPPVPASIKAKMPNIIFSKSF